MIPFLLLFVFSIVMICLFIWFIWSIFLIIKVRKGIHNINPHVYNSIPSVFMMLGVVGCLVKVFWGLELFDTHYIPQTMPHLLTSLKQGVGVLLIGVLLSLFVGKFSQVALRKAEMNEEATKVSDTDLLQEILKEVRKLNK